MIIATCTIPLKDAEGEGMAFENYMPRLIEYVKTLDDEKLLQFWEDSGREQEDYDAPQLKDVLSSAVGGITELQRKTIKVIEELQPDGSRDISYIQHKGDKIYVTGGMSWGDDPTDSYWQMVLVSEVVHAYRTKTEKDYEAISNWW